MDDNTSPPVRRTIEVRTVAIAGAAVLVVLVLAGVGWAATASERAAQKADRRIAVEQMGRALLEAGDRDALIGERARQSLADFDPWDVLDAIATSTDCVYLTADGPDAMKTLIGKQITRDQGKTLDEAFEDRADAVGCG